MRVENFCFQTRVLVRVFWQYSIGPALVLNTDTDIWCIRHGSHFRISLIGYDNNKPSVCDVQSQVHSEHIVQELHGRGSAFYQSAVMGINRECFIEATVVYTNSLKLNYKRLLSTWNVSTWKCRKVTVVGQDPILDACYLQYWYMYSRNVDYKQIWWAKVVGYWQFVGIKFRWDSWLHLYRMSDDQLLKTLTLRSADQWSVVVSGGQCGQWQAGWPALRDW